MGIETVGSTPRFCPSCGTPRSGTLRFCAGCGADLDEGPTPAATPALADRAGSNVARYAGIAWILSAALIGYLALIQLGYVGSIFDTGQFQELAIWNGLTALITLYFAARLLMSPTTKILFNSIAWAALTVVWGAYQISQGVTHDAYIGAIVAAAVAGVLSFVARQAMP